MNDSKNGYLYECWIPIDNGTSFIVKNRFHLYVAGEYK